MSLKSASQTLIEFLPPPPSSETHVTLQLKRSAVPFQPCHFSFPTHFPGGSLPHFRQIFLGNRQTYYFLLFLLSAASGCLWEKTSAAAHTTTVYSIHFLLPFPLLCGGRPPFQTAKPSRSRSNWGGHAEGRKTNSGSSLSLTFSLLPPRKTEQRHPPPAVPVRGNKMADRPAICGPGSTWWGGEQFPVQHLYLCVCVCVRVAGPP